MNNIKDIKKDIAIYDVQFGDMQNFVDRAKKIVTAIFMITDMLDEKSGIDVILRKKSLEHFQCFLDYIKDKDIKSLKKSQHSLYETLSFIDILYSTGSITEMNYNIISGELHNFKKELIASMNKNIEKKLILSDVFFERKEINIQKNKLEKALMTAQNVEEKKSDKELRHEDIINILSEKKKLSITDICSFLDGYSAKTIQRDLKELIDKKIVLKRGDRRWATYDLV